MNIKKLIITMIFIVVIVIIVIIAVLLNTQLTVDNENTNEDEKINSEKVFREIRSVDDYQEYYKVKQLVEILYQYNNDLLKENSTDNANKIMNLLNEEYIKYANITDTTVNELLGKKEVIVYVNDMFKYMQENNVEIFFINIDIIENENITNQYISVVIDTNKDTYSILLNDYVEEKYGNIENGNIVGNIEFPQIEENENNKYENIEISQSKYITDIFNTYFNKVINANEIAYQEINEEYRNERFGEISNFNKYVDENKEILEQTKLKEYAVRAYDDYTSYICKDNNDNIYIIRMDKNNNYEVFLDSYTIVMQEVENEYSSSSEPEKSKYHIENLLDAIVRNNYEYVYSKLNETFKETNFQSIEKFKMYFEPVVVEKIETESQYIDEDMEIYEYKIIFKNLETGAENSLNAFIRIGENMEFEWSFSV